MRFKYPQLQDEYKKLDQRVQNLMAQFEMWGQRNGLPEPMATHIYESLEQSEEIFWKVEQLQSLAKGVPMVEALARARARVVPSFHKLYLAIDLRDYIYTPEQYAQALAWLRAQVPVGMGDGQWEILGHDIGSGHHFHIGFRDMPRLNEWIHANPMPQ